jgi:hypothetical protein
MAAWSNYFSNRTKTVLRIAIVPTLSSEYKTPFAAGSTW